MMTIWWWVCDSYFCDLYDWKAIYVRLWYKIASVLFLGASHRKCVRLVRLFAYYVALAPHTYIMIYKLTLLLTIDITLRKTKLHEPHTLSHVIHALRAQYLFCFQFKIFICVHLWWPTKDKILRHVSTTLKWFVCVSIESTIKLVAKRNITPNALRICYHLYKLHISINIVKQCSTIK